MTTRRRSIAAALGLALVGLGASVAAAAPAAASPLTWELKPGYTQMVDGALFGDITVAPGHDESRTLIVSNVGDHDGTLTVSVVNAVIHAGSPAELAGLTVNGHSAPSLAGNETVLQTTPVPAGNSVHVPVSMAFSGPSGNSAVVGQHTFSFDIRLALSGELPAVGGDVNGVLPGATPGAGYDDGAVLPVDDPAADDGYIVSDVDAVDPDGPAVADGPVAEADRSITGPNHWPWLAAAAALAATASFALLKAVRRRRELEQA